MNEEMDRILKLAAEMEEFSPVSDDLSEMIKRYTGEAELFEEDMDLVSAAAASPKRSFEDFLKLVGKK